MANAIEELVIALGLDVSEMQDGIKAAQDHLQELGRVASSAVDAVAQSVTGNAGQAVAASQNVSVALMQTGDKGKAAADKIASSFGGLPKVLNSVRHSVLGLVTALGSALLGAKGFDDYVKTANGFEALSRKTGIAIEELDAWSKANEAAGGSAEALQSTLESFYKRTGRPATEFFKLGEKISGMSQLQAQRFLQAQGVALDAIPVFLKGQREAEKLVEKYRQTAFTAEDAKLARAYKNAWGDFARQLQAVGAVIFRAVLPAFTAVGRFLERLTKIVNENIRVFVVAGAALALAFGVKQLGNIKGIISAVKAFGLALKGSLLPLTLILGAVVAIGLAIDDLMTFAEGGDSMIERMMRSIGIGSETIEELRTVFKGVFKAFGEFWDSVKPLVGGVLKAALKGVSVVLIGIVGVVTAVVAGITLLITKVDDWAQALYDLMPSFEDIGKWLAKLGDWGSDAAKKIKDKFSGIFDLKAIGQWVQDSTKAIREGFSTAFDALGEWIQGLFGDWLKSLVSTFIEPIKNIAEAAKSGVGAMWNAAKNALGFGDGKGNPPPTAAQQGQLREQATNRPATITNTSTMNQTVNVSTRDNPQAIGAAVGHATYGATGSMNHGAMQAMSGVRLKG